MATPAEISAQLQLVQDSFASFEIDNNEANSKAFVDSVNTLSDFFPEAETLPENQQPLVTLIQRLRKNIDESFTYDVEAGQMTPSSLGINTLSDTILDLANTPLIAAERGVENDVKAIKTLQDSTINLESYNINKEQIDQAIIDLAASKNPRIQELVNREVPFEGMKDRKPETILEQLQTLIKRMLGIEGLAPAIRQTLDPIETEVSPEYQKRLEMSESSPELKGNNLTNFAGKAATKLADLGIECDHTDISVTLSDDGKIKITLPAEAYEKYAGLDEVKKGNFKNAVRDSFKTTSEEAVGLKNNSEKDVEYGTSRIENLQKKESDIASAKSSSLTEAASKFLTRNKDSISGEIKQINNAQKAIDTINRGADRDTGVIQSKIDRLIDNYAAKLARDTHGTVLPNASKKEARQKLEQQIKDELKDACEKGTNSPEFLKIGAKYTELSVKKLSNMLAEQQTIKENAAVKIAGEKTKIDTAYEYAKLKLNRRDLEIKEKTTSVAALRETRELGSLLHQASYEHFGVSKYDNQPGKLFQSNMANDLDRADRNSQISKLKRDVEKGGIAINEIAEARASLAEEIASLRVAQSKGEKTFKNPNELYQEAFTKWQKNDGKNHSDTMKDYGSIVKIGAIAKVEAAFGDKSNTPGHGAYLQVNDQLQSLEDKTAGRLAEQAKLKEADTERMTEWNRKTTAEKYAPKAFGDQGITTKVKDALKDTGAVMETKAHGLKEGRTHRVFGADIMPNSGRSESSAAASKDAGGIQLHDQNKGLENIDSNDLAKIKEQISNSGVNLADLKAQRAELDTPLTKENLNKLGNVLRKDGSTLSNDTASVTSGGTSIRSKDNFAELEAAKEAEK